MNNQNAFFLIECARGMGPAPFRVLVPGASQRSVHTHDAFHEQCALARFIAQRAINASLRAAAGASTALPTTPATTTWSPATPAQATDQLIARLQRGYSQSLYGAEGRVPSDVRVVWLRLVDNTTLRSLPRICLCVSAPPERPFYTPNSVMHNPADTLWLHVATPTPQLPDNSWAEVTHCPDDWTPLWFYHSPGSGLSINIGRTLLLRRDAPADSWKRRLVTQLHADPRADTAAGRNASLLVARLIGRGFDSVQLADHQEAYSSELKHEIVMLRWPARLRPNQTLADAVRCGRHPFLVPCSPAHAAVRMHEVCSRGFEDRRVHELVDVGVCGGAEASTRQRRDRSALRPL